MSQAGTGKKALFIGGAAIALLLMAWLGYGLYVYWRNPVPTFELPPAPPALPNNAYPQIIECAAQIREAGKLAAMEQLPNYGTLQQKQEVIEANRTLLQKIRSILPKPAQVIHLEYQTGDPTMDNYRNIARLFVAEAKLYEQQGKYGHALSSYLDGFTFLEKVLNGGNVLQLTYHFMGSIPLFQSAHSLLPKLSAQEALEGARRLEQLIANEYPLSTLLAQDFRSWLTGWQRIVRGQSMRGFRLDLPKSDLERDILYMPKQPLSKAAQQYAQMWLDQAKLPFPEQRVIEYPPALQQLGRDLVVRMPDDIALQVARYTYVRTRLRLLYTALRLEAYRKARGRYPASLKDLGNSPYFIDPFSNKPFVYRPQGNGYVLYSLGPNSIDDGGTPFPEGKLNRAQPGDIGLVPNFPSRPS